MDSIQVVILCGGSGTRLREQTEFIPKPLIPIGGIPMVVHIMRLYAHYGFTDFILALGYKQEEFKKYFTNYDVINNDVTIDLGRYNGMNHHEYKDRWRVTLADTGVDTMKGGRLLRIRKYIHGKTFMCTYGDSIGNINIPALLDFHQSHGKMVTITGVHPVPRFGEIIHDNGQVIQFSEKPDNDSWTVNGGFMVMDSEIFQCLEEGFDLEVDVFSTLVKMGELMVYEHFGWWGCMDTMKDVESLQAEWKTGEARWLV